MRFALFALAEYVEVFVLCGVAAALFLGGYTLPFGIGDYIVQKWEGNLFLGKGLNQFLQMGSFLVKTLFLYYVVIWVRWTFPRLRVDQLMTICWKYLTPIALFNLVGCAFWMYIFKGQSFWMLWQQ